MTSVDSKQTLCALFAPQVDDELGRQRDESDTLPTIERRVELYLRAVHGARPATEEQRADARRRILEAMAVDMANALETSTMARATVNQETQALSKATVNTSQSSRLVNILRDALIWPLLTPIGTGSPWRFAAISFATLVFAGVAWSAVWFYAARAAESVIASWVDSEAKSGRTYSCGSQGIGGFPVRIELSCVGLNVTLANAAQPTLIVNELRTVVSPLAPHTLVTTINGPISVRSNQSATFVGDWSRAQLTLQSSPDSLGQVSLALDEPTFSRLSGDNKKPVLVGGRLELGAVPAGISGIKIVAHATGVSFPEGDPITAQPFLADISAVLRNLPKSPARLAVLLHDWQSRGGSLEVTEARIQQGDAVAIGAGQLRLNDAGRIEGALSVAATDTYQQLARTYSLDAKSGTRERERIAQSLPADSRSRSRSLGTPETAQPADRPQTMQRQAGKMDIPIRFVDGRVYLEFTPIGEIAPLF
jgi:hypothetical protein